MSCYNVGSGGQTIFFHLALLYAAIERHPPKIVILDIVGGDFQLSPQARSVEKLGVLLPFTAYTNAARNAVLRRENFEEIKLFARSYKFNSLQYQMFRNNVYPFHNHINGFMSIDRIMKRPYKEQVLNNLPFDTTKLKAIYDFINTCKRYHIKVYVFISPIFNLSNQNSVFMKFSDDIYKHTGVEVINLEDDSIFLQNPKLFADPYHLNKEGANEYTSLIASIISSCSDKSIRK